MNRLTNPPLYHKIHLQLNKMSTWVPIPRMGRFNGEAGESPALSRNCKSDLGASV
jgi:hypothetical protein